MPDGIVAHQAWISRMVACNSDNNIHFPFYFNAHMAQQSNYYDAALLAFQGPVEDEFNAAELRELPEQMLYYGLQNQQFLQVSNITKIKESVNRPVYAYLKVRKPSTNGTAMTAFHTGIGGTAAQQVIQWIAFTEEFYINETEAMDNALFPGNDKYSLFKNEMSQAQRNLRERIYTWTLQQTYNARTGATYNGNTVLPLATLNTAYNTWEISGSAATQPWSSITSTMRTNKYGYSGYEIFADSLLHATSYEYQQAQGVENAQNLAYQFTKDPVMGNKAGRLGGIYEDVLLGQPGGVPYVGGYSSGGAICLPKNSFAFIPWMPKIYMEGSGNMEDYAGGYGTVADEMMPGMEYMVHGWRTQADTTLSGGRGYTQDSVVQIQVGYYIAYVQQYISNSNESPIYFFALKP